MSLNAAKQFRGSALPESKDGASTPLLSGLEEDLENPVGGNVAVGDAVMDESAWEEKQWRVEWEDMQRLHERPHTLHQTSTIFALWPQLQDAG